MGLDGEMAVVPNQGYHLETYGKIPTGIGDVEREEEERAEFIEARVAERQRKERRNFKGY